MYFHNFGFFAMVTVVTIAAYLTGSSALLFLMGLGVFPHLSLDLIDDLIVLRNLNNWMNIPGSRK
jgi:hypothetical protein